MAAGGTAGAAAAARLEEVARAVLAQMEEVARAVALME